MTEAPTSTPFAYDSKIEGNVVITKLDAAINWMRKNYDRPTPHCCSHFGSLHPRRSYDIISM